MDQITLRCMLHYPMLSKISVIMRLEITQLWNDDVYSWKGAPDW